MDKTIKKVKQRYKTLILEVAERKPKTILEIGVWNGINGLKMIEEAKKYNNVKYYGFDLFENISSKTKTEEHHTKRNINKYIVKRQLNKTGISFELIVGNTRETLPKFSPKEEIDFVFIDGGHSLDTIKSDWNEVNRIINKDSVVIFDDYYENREDWGCRSLVSSLSDSDFIITKLEPLDMQGNLVRLVKVQKR